MSSGLVTRTLQSSARALPPRAVSPAAPPRAAHGRPSSRVGISVKLAGVMVACVAGMAVIAAIAIHDVHDDIMAERSAALEKLVETASSVLVAHAATVERGEATLQQAQAAALADIKRLRYDANQYFWVNDMTPRMLMHPVKPELDGTDLASQKDADGKALFVEMTSVVRAHGAGVVEYMWPKPGEQAPQPKLSYVAGFKPWGWIVGTGIYIDDVDDAVAARSQFRQDRRHHPGVGAAGRPAAHPRHHGRRAEAHRIDAVAGRGDRSIAIPALARTDEIGAMARALQVLKENAAHMAELEEQSKAQEALAVAKHKEETRPAGRRAARRPSAPSPAP
ncbi:MAG: cache domain-containing protein [Myxococcota bacterium]